MTLLIITVEPNLLAESSFEFDGIWWLHTKTQTEIDKLLPISLKNTTFHYIHHQTQMFNNEPNIHITPSNNNNNILQYIQHPPSNTTIFSMKYQQKHIWTDSIHHHTPHHSPSKAIIYHCQQFHQHQRSPSNTNSNIVQHIQHPPSNITTFTIKYQQ